MMSMARERRKDECARRVFFLQRKGTPNGGYYILRNNPGRVERGEGERERRRQRRKISASVMVQLVRKQSARSNHVLAAQCHTIWEIMPRVRSVTSRHAFLGLLKIRRCPRAAAGDWHYKTNQEADASIRATEQRVGSGSATRIGTPWTGWAVLPLRR